MGLIAHCQAENARLRELYENVTGNRERFGWTINHLLECEEALRVAEEQLAGTLEAFARERQDVLNCVNLYGDETLHKALDSIGWPADYIGGQ